MTTITAVKLARVAIGTETIKDVSSTSLVTLSAGDLILVATVADQTPVMAQQQTTVRNSNPLNVNWMRYVPASNAAVSIMRTGSSGVAFLTSVLARVAALLQQSLTWTPPVVIAQPVSNVSFVHGGSNNAAFVVSFGSEL